MREEHRYRQRIAISKNLEIISYAPRRHKAPRPLARYLALRQRTDEGLPLALRAVRGDPSCWQCFDTLALLLAQKGAFDKAKEAQSLALSLVPEGVDGSSLAKSLRRYEKAAQNSGAGSAPSSDTAQAAPAY